MMPSGLLPSEMPAYLRGLNSQAAQRVTFTLMKLDHTVLRDLRPVALDGQVDFNDDGSADVLRRLQAGFFDPDHALHLDADSPTDGVAGMNRLIRVTVSHLIEELGRWVSVPVFTGRPSVIARDGAKVMVQAQDKACLHLRNAPIDYISRNTPVIAAIHDGLYAAGERFFRFPPVHSVPDKVLKHTVVGGPNDEHQPWKVWRKLAHDAGLQLYPDGAGYFVLRPYPYSDPTVTWDASNLTSNVQTETDLTTIRNRVVVNGHGHQVGRATAQAGEEFSPAHLAIGDENWVNIAFLDATNLRGHRLDKFATKQLAKVLTETTTVRMNVAPMFHLDPLDWCAVNLASGRLGFALREASLPLGDDSDMPIGSQKRVRSASAGRIGVAA